jgi:hypothetical protein
MTGWWVPSSSPWVETFISLSAFIAPEWGLFAPACVSAGGLCFAEGAGCGFVSASKISVPRSSGDWFDDWVVGPRFEAKKATCEVVRRRAARPETSTATSRASPVRIPKRKTALFALPVGLFWLCRSIYWRGRPIVGSWPGQLIDFGIQVIYVGRLYRLHFENQGRQVPHHIEDGGIELSYFKQ